MEPIAGDDAGSSPLAQRPAAITMDDVARAAGVSKSAVSRALNRVPGAVAQATAERVWRAVEELGYVPNAIAASLKHQRTRTVGLLLSDLGNPFFALVASGVAAEIRTAGYTLLVADAGRDDERQMALTRTLLERQVDALLLASSGADDAHLQLALARGVHVVLVDSHPRRSRVDCVMADNRGGAEQAIRHLVELGHRSIAVLGGRRTDSSARERLQGTRKALQASGLELSSEHSFAGDFGIASGYTGAQELLGRAARPTALFVTNNLMTVGAMHAIRDLRLRVPRDVSLVGFDDMEWYPLARPPITAVSQPAVEIGRRAAQELLAQIGGLRRGRPRTILLPTELIVRESTAPPLKSGGRRRSR